MGYPHVWTDKQTETITFPHSSDADGNESCDTFEVLYEKNLTFLYKIDIEFLSFIQFQQKTMLLPVGIELITLTITGSNARFFVHSANRDVLNAMIFN